MENIASHFNPSPVETVYVHVHHKDGSQEVYTLRDLTGFEYKNKLQYSDNMTVKLKGAGEKEVRSAPPKPTKAGQLWDKHVGMWLDHPKVHGVIESVTPIETSNRFEDWDVSYALVEVGYDRYRLDADDPIKVKDM